MSKISPARKELKNDVNDLKDIWGSGAVFWLYSLDNEGSHEGFKAEGHKKKKKTVFGKDLTEGNVHSIVVSKD